MLARAESGMWSPGWGCMSRAGAQRAVSSIRKPGYKGPEGSVGDQLLLCKDHKPRDLKQDRQALLWSQGQKSKTGQRDRWCWFLLGTPGVWGPRPLPFPASSGLQHSGFMVLTSSGGHLGPRPSPLLTPLRSIQEPW